MTNNQDDARMWEKLNKSSQEDLFEASYARKKLRQITLGKQLCGGNTDTEETKEFVQEPRVRKSKKKSSSKTSKCKKWTPEEEQIVKDYIVKNGKDNIDPLCQKLNRNKSSIWARYRDKLDPANDNSPLSTEEECLLLKYYADNGTTASANSLFMNRNPYFLKQCFSKIVVREIPKLQTNSKSKNSLPKVFQQERTFGRREIERSISPNDTMDVAKIIYAKLVNEPHSGEDILTLCESVEDNNVQIKQETTDINCASQPATISKRKKKRNLKYEEKFIDLCDSQMTTYTEKPPTERLVKLEDCSSVKSKKSTRTKSKKKHSKSKQKKDPQSPRSQKSKRSLSSKDRQKLEGLKSILDIKGLKLSSAMLKKNKLFVEFEVPFLDA